MGEPSLAGTVREGHALPLLTVLVLLWGRNMLIYLFVCCFSVSPTRARSMAFVRFCTPESMASGAMPGTEQALQSRLLSE